MNRHVVAVALLLAAAPSYAQRVTAEQAFIRARQELRLLPSAQDSLIVSSSAELGFGPESGLRFFHVTPEEKAKWLQLFEGREYWKVSFVLARRYNQRMTWQIHYYIDAKTGESIPRMPGA